MSMGVTAIQITTGGIDVNYYYLVEANLNLKIEYYAFIELRLVYVSLCL